MHLKYNDITSLSHAVTSIDILTHPPHSCLEPRERCPARRSLTHDTRHHRCRPIGFSVEANGFGFQFPWPPQTIKQPFGKGPAAHPARKTNRSDGLKWKETTVETGNFQPALLASMPGQVTHLSSNGFFWDEIPKNPNHTQEV